MEFNNEKKYFRIDNRLFISIFWNNLYSNLSNSNFNNNYFIGGIYVKSD